MTDDRDQSWQPFDDGSNPEPEGDFSAAPPAGDGTAVPAKGAALLSRLLDRQEKIIDRSVEDLDDVISELKRIAGTSGHHTVESGSDRAAPGAADGDKADTAPVKREESSFPQREVRTTPAVDASAPPLESPPPTAAVSPGASKSAGNVPAQQPSSGKVQEAPPKAFEEPPKVQAAAARPAEAAVAPQPQQNDVAPATKAESVSASKATVDAAPAAKAESALASKAAVDAAPAAKAESGSVPKAAAEAAPVEPSAPAPEAAHPGQAAGNGDSSTERTARASRPAAQSEQAEPELVLKAEAPRARTDEPARQEMKNKPVLPGITIEGDRGPVMAKEQLPGGKGPTGVDKGRGGGGGGGGGGDGVFHKRLGPIDFSASLKAGLRAVKQNLIVVMIFTVATNILVLAIPVYLFQISDRVLTSRSLDTLVMLTVVIVGAVILQAVFDAVRRFILMRTAVEVAAQLGGPILSAAARASLNSNGREYQTLGDLQQLRSFLVSGTLLAFLDAPIAPLFVLAVFLIHPHLGFIVVATALMLLAITLANQRATAAPFGEANSHQTRANLHVESMSRNSQIINALAMIPEAVVIWGKETAESLKSQVTAQDRNIAFASMSKAVRLLTQVLMLGWGAYLAIEGTVTGGMVIAASIIAGRALGPIEGAIEGWNQVVQSRAAYGRISALLKESPLNFERLKLPRPEGRLDVERLLFVPQGTKRVVLNGVTFSLSPGDSLAIIGNSGAGKTTLGKMLVGSILPTSGNVRLDLMDLRNWDPRQFGESIGYLPQDVQLFPGSIKANIGRMREDATDAEIFEAARLADVHELIASLPHGYETFVAADGAPLSGGQKQRIGLARAFFGSPKMIVLDEPNSNLDTAGELALSRTLERAKEQKITVITITQRPALLQTVDKILVLVNGTVVLFGMRQDVLQALAQRGMSMDGGPFSNIQIK